MYRVEIDGKGIDIVSLRVMMKDSAMGSATIYTLSDVEPMKTACIYRRGSLLMKGIVTRKKRVDNLWEITVLDMSRELAAKILSKSYANAILTDILLDITDLTGIGFETDSPSGRSRAWANFSSWTRNDYALLDENGYLVLYPEPDLEFDFKLDDYAVDFSYPDDPYHYEKTGDPEYGITNGYYHVDCDSDDIFRFYFDVYEKGDKYAYAKTSIKVRAISTGVPIYYRRDDGTYEKITVTNSSAWTTKYKNIDRLQYVKILVGSARWIDFDDFYCYEWGVRIHSLPEWITQVKVNSDSYDVDNGEVNFNLEQYSSSPPVDLTFTLVRYDGYEVSKTFSVDRGNRYKYVAKTSPGEAYIDHAPIGIDGWKTFSVVSDGDVTIEVRDPDTDNVLAGPVTGTSPSLDISSIDSSTYPSLRFVIKGATNEKVTVTQARVDYEVTGFNYDADSDCLDVLKTVTEMANKYWRWKHDWSKIEVKSLSNFTTEIPVDILDASVEADSRFFANKVVVHYNGGTATVQDDASIQSIGEYVAHVANKDISDETTAKKYAQTLLDVLEKQIRLRAEITISEPFVWTKTYDVDYEVTITERSGNNLINYAVKIELDENNFSDWDKVQPDGSDIYFTDEEGNPLHYWIESIDISAKQATIWVKIPLIPANDSVTIRMYCGDDNPYSEYNGPEQVFVLWDDFEQERGWTWSQNGSAWEGEYSDKYYHSPTYSYRIRYPSGTASSSGYYGAISKELNVPVEQLLVELYVRDSYAGDVSGYHFKQVLADETVIWEDDVAGDEGGFAKALAVFTPESENIVFTLRVYDKKGVSNFGIDVYWDDVVIRPYVDPEPDVSLRRVFQTFTETHILWVIRPLDRITYEDSQYIVREVAYEWDKNGERITIVAGLPEADLARDIQKIPRVERWATT